MIEQEIDLKNAIDALIIGVDSEQEERDSEILIVESYQVFIQTLELVKDVVK